MTEQASIHPVDEVLPWRQLAIFGLQHVLVVVTFPISSAFLIAKSLSLSSELTIDLISAAFLVCGIGTLVQSLGLWRFGARMPFVMVPGGAPILLFVLVAKQTDLQTAVGSVMIAAAAYFLVLPVFAKCLRFFPRIVIGTVLIIVSVNLIKIYGATIIGTPNTPDFASPIKVCLALATVGCTVVSAMLFKGFLGRLSVLLGLLAGSILAAALGVMHFDGVFSGPLLTFPSPMPFGVPHFDLLAALPLVIFSVISMVEATGQTVAIAEVVGKEIDPKEMVSRTIRTDALMSLIGGFFGTSMIITSSENVGVVQATGVRSRYVTVAAGIFLIVIAVLAPVGRLANAIPAPVIGGAALIAFSIIGVIGINFMRGLDLHERSSMFTLASGLTMGLLPIVVPGIYSNFPQGLQTILNNGLAIGAITAVVVNILFNYISLGSGYFTGKPELETQEGLGTLALILNENRQYGGLARPLSEMEEFPMSMPTSIDSTSLNQWYAIAAVSDVTPNSIGSSTLLEIPINYTVNREGTIGTAWRSSSHLHEDNARNPTSPGSQLPVRLAYGYLWTSLGKPEAEIFPIPEYDEPDRRRVHAGTIGVHTSAPRAIENFLDMGHFPYVHTGILGVEPYTEVKEYDVEISVERDEILATRCRFYQPKGSSVAKTGIDVDYIYRVPHPFCSVLYKMAGPDKTRPNVIALFLQPVDQEHVRAHMLMCILDDENEDKAIRSFQQTIFGQDKPILENQLPKRLPLDPRAETPIRADKSAVAYRRWLSQKGVNYGAIPVPV